MLNEWIYGIYVRGKTSILKTKWNEMESGSLKLNVSVC